MREGTPREHPRAAEGVHKRVPENATSALEICSREDNLANNPDSLLIDFPEAAARLGSKADASGLVWQGHKRVWTEGCACQALQLFYHEELVSLTSDIKHSIDLAAAPAVHLQQHRGLA